MIFISHRGNTTGPNPEQENSPDYIDNVLVEGYYVEVDVRLNVNNELYLGHDFGQYKTSIKFLQHPKIICHAKTPDTLALLLNNNIHCFSHDKDQVVLTSNNWLWTYPGEKLTNMSIAVMPECTTINWDLTSCFGICSDYITYSNP